LNKEKNRRRRRYGQNNINGKGSLKKRTIDRKDYYNIKAKKYQKLLNKFKSPHRNRNIKYLENNKNKVFSYNNSILNVGNNTSLPPDIGEECKIVLNIFEKWKLLNITSFLESIKKEEYYNENFNNTYICCYNNNYVICENDKIVEITIEDNKIIENNKNNENNENNKNNENNENNENNKNNKNNEPPVFPEELCNLKDLKKLSITTNELCGSIPENIGNLINLEYLWLYYNNLTGTIPPSIGNLTKLKSLNLHGNNLSGNIIDEIGNLVSLETLDLHKNQLEGDIPDSLKELQNLKRLYLNENNLNITTGYNLTNLVSCKFDTAVGKISQSFNDTLKSYSCASAAISITISIPSLFLFTLINLFLLFKLSLL